MKAALRSPTATVLVPAQADRVIEDMRAASDGLYVLARRGVYSTLLRVPTGGSKDRRDIRFRQKVTLRRPSPIRASPESPSISRAGCCRRSEYALRPGNREILHPRDRSSGRHVNPAKFTVSDREAKAHDGAMIPLTIIQPVGGASKPQITLVEAYGSYGYSLRRGVQFRVARR